MILNCNSFFIVLLPTLTFIVHYNNQLKRHEELFNPFWAIIIEYNQGGMYNKTKCIRN